MVCQFKSISVSDDFWILVRFGIRFLHVSEKAARGISSRGKAARWIFAPYGPHPSRFWRLVPWCFFSLGCRRDISAFS